MLEFRFQPRLLPLVLFIVTMVSARVLAAEPLPPQSLVRALGAMRHFQTKRSVYDFLAKNSSAEDAEFLRQKMTLINGSLDEPFVVFLKGSKMKIHGIEGELIWHPQGPMIEYKGRMLRPLSKTKSLAQVYETLALAFQRQTTQGRPTSFLQWVYVTLLPATFAQGLDEVSIGAAVAEDTLVGLTAALRFSQKYTDKGDPLFQKVDENDQANIRNTFNKMGVMLDTVTCSKEKGKRTATARFFPPKLHSGALTTSKEHTVPLTVIVSTDENGAAKQNLRAIQGAKEVTAKMPKNEGMKDAMRTLDSLCTDVDEKTRRQYIDSVVILSGDREKGRGIFSNGVE